MKAKLALLLCVLLCNPAFAEWKKFSDTSKKAIYIDPDAIRWDGDIVKFWLLTDFKSVQNDEENGKFMSLRAQVYINCADETSSSMYISGHPKQQAKGGTAFTHTVKIPKWEPMPPDTLFYDIGEVLCKSKK